MSSKVHKKNKANKLIYSIINITENTKEKECISADKKNEKKYRETIEKLGVTTKEWENTGVMLNLEIPTPPNPSNYENLLEYRRTHVLRPAIVQSEATIYLHDRGYKLGIDYQAYQAIEIVNKLQEYEREDTLPEIHNKSLSSTEVDLSVLNISRDTEKRRTTMDMNFQRKASINKKKDIRNSFNYGSFKRKQQKNKTKNFVEPNSVSEIAKKINQDCASGKPKSRFNTLRRKSFKNNPNPSNQLFSDSNSRPLEVKGNRFGTTSFSYHQNPELPNNSMGINIQPSAPPMPPDYYQKFGPNQFVNSYNSQDCNNSNSSVDSLFDSEEMKQFEKKYNPQKGNNNEAQYRSNQKKYNGIYPPLQNVNQESESDGDDFCSV